jgi:hypothetical protein
MLMSTSRAPLCTLLCAAAVLLVGGAGRASEGGDDHQSRVASILSSKHTVEEDLSTALSRELERLGPQVISALLATLESGHISSPLDEQVELVPLDEIQEEALYLALTSFGLEVLAPQLEQALHESPPTARRVVVLRLLGRVGTVGQLDLAVRAAAPEEGEESIEQAVRTALKGTVEAILRRDPAGYDTLKRLIYDAGPDVAASLVMGAAAAGSPRALGLAVELLGWDEKRDLLLLSQIASVAPQVPRPVDEHVRASARAYLLKDDVQLVRTAALACGHLEDYDALTTLIALLDHEDAGVRDAAYWSLQHVAGVGLPAESQRWQIWLRGEEEWFAQQARILFEDLRHRDPARVVRALNELSGRRFQRDLIAREIAAALAQGQPEIRRSACAALGRLGSPAAIADLVRCLEDPSPLLAAQAWAALKLITGADLPAEAEAWSRAYLSG